VAGAGSFSKEVLNTSVVAVTTEVFGVLSHLNPISLRVVMSPDSNESETSNSLLASVLKANKLDKKKTKGNSCIIFPDNKCPSFEHTLGPLQCIPHMGVFWLPIVKSA